MSDLIAGLQTRVEDLSARTRDDRLIDLAIDALDAVELIDRNHHERTCDVRWWAINVAIVDCATTSSPALVAHGRPKRFGDVIGRDVSAESRFVRAASLPDGESYVARQVCLGNAHVATTYCAGVRAGGESRT